MKKRKYTNKKIIFNLYWILIGSIVIALTACSSDSTTEFTEGNAQDIYNRLKGIYQGPVIVENIPQNVTITIANDFSVKRLPLKPILSRIFNDESLLAEAISSAHDVVFIAPTQNLQVTVYNVHLTMEPTDFIFHVTVGGKVYQINAFTKSEVYKINSNTISANLEITELLCDGTPYDLSNTPIIYYVDLANRLAD